jgi:hypothetical protein
MAETTPADPVAESDPKTSPNAGGVDMALIPEKYRVEGDPAASLAKWRDGHGELEKSYTQAQQGKGDDESGLSIGGRNVMDGTIDQVLANAGSSMDEAGAMIRETGELTPELYGKLAGMGVGRLLVDNIIQNAVQAQQGAAFMKEQTQQQAEAVAGGADQTQAVLAWAQGNLSAAEQTDMNRRLGDPTLMVGAMQDLVGRFNAATGRAAAGTIIPGGGPGAGAPSSGVNNENFFETLNRARGGDRQAQEALNTAREAGEVDGAI